MTAHPIVIGYGSIGRNAARAIADAGLGSDLVVVDHDPVRAGLARRDGARSVLGDACDLGLLRRAGTSEAGSVTIAVATDSEAVRITSRVRGLNKHATICTSLRSGGWSPVAEYLGADQVVAASRMAGRLLGLSTRRPGLLAEFRRALRQPPKWLSRNALSAQVRSDSIRRAVARSYWQSSAGAESDGATTLRRRYYARPIDFSLSARHGRQRQHYDHAPGLADLCGDTRYPTFDDLSEARWIACSAQSSDPVSLATGAV
ncbi:NAD(P)-binding protein [Nocardia sp. CS682]|uniref:NAD(P)-binding protein n=1 Tax=Nocardia sp. CS682 TaxID=1047172 RepID=UPI001074DB17|nr:hypothetical protein DMB37_37050 [Nocardia sp. CS682]